MDNLRYQVTIRMRGIPTHAWHVSTTCKLLSLMCSNLQPSEATLAKVNLRHFIVDAWCAHPNLIPQESILHIDKPPVVRSQGPPMFIDPEQVIYNSWPMLHYMVSIDSLEIIDWRRGSSDSSSNDGNDGGWPHEP
jgi:hypothetical protein